MSLYVESRTQVADGKHPGFSELHITPARTGGRRLGARAAPPIRETVFGRGAGHKSGDDHVTRASDAMDRGDGQQAQSQSPMARPRVPVAERARASRTGRGPWITVPGFGTGERETGRAAAGATRPVGSDARQASNRATGIPSSRALSTRFSLMPPPGKATRPVGRSLRSWSLRRNGAARPWAFQSGRNTTWCTAWLSAQRAAMRSAPGPLSVLSVSDGEALGLFDGCRWSGRSLDGMEPRGGVAGSVARSFPFPFPSTPRVGTRERHRERLRPVPCRCWQRPGERSGSARRRPARRGLRARVGGARR